MSRSKYQNMLAAYPGFKGRVTLQTIRRQIPRELIPALTGKQLALVMTAINTAYHAGRASTGAEVHDDCKRDGAVWIEALGRSISWREADGRLICEAGPAH